MAEKHLSSQFDAELSNISTRVLEMGGLVESQLRQCIYAMHHMSVETANQVLDLEQKVNRLEIEIDHDGAVYRLRVTSLGKLILTK